MKKLAIVIVIAALAGFAAYTGYSKVSGKLNNQESNSNISLSRQSTNSNNQNNNNESNLNNQSNENNNNQNSNVATVSSVSNNQGISSNNQTVSNQNSSSVGEQSFFNIGPEFTASEINTLNTLGVAQKIDTGAGTISPVINLNYYSVVNGEKYYMEYTNQLTGNNWMMGGLVTPNQNGNYSWIKFNGYVNAKGEQISKEQFLSGVLSFNINNPTNLSDQDKINMIKKIAAMYFNFGGYQNTEQSMRVSKKYLETGYEPNSLSSMANMTVNLNNTIQMNGQTLYALEVKSNEPFYISLTGDIYVGQEHYLSGPFNIKSLTNAQVKQAEKGM